MMQRRFVNYALAVGLAVAGWSVSAPQAEAGRWAVGYVAGPVPAPVYAPVVAAPVVVPAAPVIQPVGGIVVGQPVAPGYVAAPGPVVVNQWGHRGLLHNRYNVRVSSPYGPDYVYRVRRNLTGTHVRQFVAP
ncbi:MAG TPA: hypothetical protein VHB77_02855 [Planctomycetaceae bacterium]|nr:hypothetical protein [Planctomycetaceae bacterium]